jgi:predicted RNA-binding Zn-ribbon protein involved in translation (DUF1610 family)
MSDVSSLHRTLEQELLALLRGASMECLVCGEFVMRKGAHLHCPECGSTLRVQVERAAAGTALDRVTG